MTAPSGRLPFPLYVALRYLKSARRDAFVTFLSATAAGGMALGVAALVLALSALSGLQAALRGEILARTPELEVEPRAGSEPEAVRRAVAADPEVRATWLTAQGRGWLLAGGRVRPVELVGFEGSLPDSFPGASGRGEGLYVSDRLATAWALEPGAIVEVASARPTLSPLGPLPRTRRLPLAGTFAAGRTEQEERLALPLAEARSLLGDGALRVLGATGDLRTALRAGRRLEAALGAGAAVRTWREINRGLFFALRLEKTVMFVAVFLIVLVAGLALVADLTLVIANKRPEIGMLGAMGATPRALERVFLWLGGLLAALGGGLGLAGGLAGAWLLDRYELLALPSQVYFLDHVPFRFEPLDLGAALAAATLLTLGSAAWAARRAAALTPIEALRR